MGIKIYRFKDILEAEEFKWNEIIKKGLPYWKFDRYEFARLNIKFTPGRYRFKNIMEKREWEFKEVCNKWRKQV